MLPYPPALPTCKKCKGFLMACKDAPGFTYCPNCDEGKDKGDYTADPREIRKKITEHVWRIAHNKK